MKGEKLAKKLILVGVVFLAAGTMAGLVYAQGTPAQNESLTATSCSDLIKPFSINVEINPELTQTLAGSQMRFFATVTNSNEFPIINGEVYVKIFQKQTDVTKTSQNGNFLVDQFFAKENLNLKAKEAKKIDFLWTVPAWATGGDYLIYSYFVGSKRFELAGLPYTDIISSGRAEFRVMSEIKKAIILDRNGVKINDKSYALFGLTSFTKDEPITVKVPLQNPTGEKQTVVINYELYSWNNLLSSQKIDSKQETIDLKAGETKVLTYQVADSKYPFYYFVAGTKWKDASSILDLGLSRVGIDSPRLGLSTVTNFPIKAGEKNTVFLCIQNVGTSDSIGGKVDVSLLDEQGSPIKQYSYIGEIKNELMALKTEFTADKNYNKFTIKTLVSDSQGKLVDSTEQKYSCQTIDPTSCTKEVDATTTPPQTSPSSGTKMLYLLIGLGVVIVGVVVLIIFKRRGGNQLPSTLNETVMPPNQGQEQTTNSFRQ